MNNLFSHPSLIILPLEKATYSPITLEEWSEKGFKEPVKRFKK